MAIKDGLKSLFDRVTFKEPEYFDGEGEALKVDSNYEYETSRYDDSEKVMKFTEGGKNKSSLRFYKLKGNEWLEVVRKATTDFKEGSVVLINTEEANKDSVTRMLDFMGGVAYSHNGRLVRQGSMTHAVIPANCDVSGDDIGGDIYETVGGFGGGSSLFD
jgi:hypothetical protein